MLVLVLNLKSGLGLPAILEPVEAARSLFATTRTTLFVFGDSYVDVGNTIPLSAAFFIPYGITEPGLPTGRFSDGNVLSDFIGNAQRIHACFQIHFGHLGF